MRSDNRHGKVSPRKTLHLPVLYYIPQHVSSESSGGDNFDNSSLVIKGFCYFKLSSVTSYESQHFIVSHETATQTDSEQTLKLEGWTVSTDSLIQLEFHRKPRITAWVLEFGNQIFGWDKWSS